MVCTLRVRGLHLTRSAALEQPVATIARLRHPQPLGIVRMNLSPPRLLFIVKQALPFKVMTARIAAGKRRVGARAAKGATLQAEPCLPGTATRQMCYTASFSRGVEQPGSSLGS